MFLAADALRVEKRETGVALLYRRRNVLKTGNAKFSPFFIVFILLCSSRFRGDLFERRVWAYNNGDKTRR